MHGKTGWPRVEKTRKFTIRVLTKLPNTEQSSKGKGKTQNQQNQSTTGKLGKPQWPWHGTGISKEMVGWIRFYGTKPPTPITVKSICRLGISQGFPLYLAKYHVGCYIVVIQNVVLKLDSVFI